LSSRGERSFARASTATITLVAESDPDGDGIPTGLDNCPDDWRQGQEDLDEDGVGDACNDAGDFDGDEWSDILDSCPDDPNPLQEDADLDLIGDVCDPFPNDLDNEQAQCELDLAICEASPTPTTGDWSFGVLAGALVGLGLGSLLGRRVGGRTA
jgi:hypothetical protein